MKKILVFVVRHGEREDEALMLEPKPSTSEKSSYRKTSKQDKVDPALTPKGHCQALQAFEGVLEALEASEQSHKVAVFSSPLRRAIGTAMMLSAAASARRSEGGTGTSLELASVQGSSKESKIHFVLPTLSWKQTTSDAGHSTDDDHDSALPIVVHNGLSNCTALVARLGGSRNLVCAGLLSCAAMPRNTLDHPDNHYIRDSLENMRLVASENEKIRHAIDTCTIQRPVQFWRVEEGLQIGTSFFVPMAPPVCLEPNESVDETSPSHTHRVLPPCYDADGQKPIDQVVQTALEAGCDACIVSSHREEIRDLYKYRCSYQNRTHKEIPYGCIAVYEAYNDDEWKSGIGSSPEPVSSLHWIFHGMYAPDQLPKSIVNDSSGTSEPSQNHPSFPITYPVIERTTLVLCEASLVVNDLAHHRSISKVTAFTMTGMHPTQSHQEDDVARPETFQLNLEIVRGHHSWLEFLMRLEDDEAHGTIEFYQTSGVCKKGKVVVRPFRQGRLPCPPKTILVQVEQ
jgi:Histidine phosphatase superfamily (branch 1)